MDGEQADMRDLLPISAPKSDHPARPRLARSGAVVRRYPGVPGTFVFPRLASAPPGFPVEAARLRPHRSCLRSRDNFAGDTGRTSVTGDALSSGPVRHESPLEPDPGLRPIVLATAAVGICREPPPMLVSSSGQSLYRAARKENRFLSRFPGSGTFPRPRRRHAPDNARPDTPRLPEPAVGMRCDSGESMTEGSFRHRFTALWPLCRRRAAALTPECRDPTCASGPARHRVQGLGRKLPCVGTCAFRLRPFAGFAAVPPCGRVSRVRSRKT
jgi:hypothetical protein